MQKILFLMLALTVSTSISAQQLMAEVFSAYNMTAYDSDVLDKGSYFPLGLRVAGGHEYVQLGLEYRQNITNPELNVQDFPEAQVQYEESYYGALLRVNLSSLPVYRAGLVLKGGAGYYNYNQKLYDQTNNKLVDEHKFDKKLGYNAGAGLSLPIYGMFHLELGWQYNIVGRDKFALEDLLIPEYQGNYHSFQFGFSTNWMFGKKSIECRNRRHKSRGKHGREGWYRKS